ncbi:MAG: adenylate/guanylate cyclase domain-containing protein [Azospirillaceae bacterium]
MAYPVPENETERNEVVRSYRIMDTQPELAFDEIGELAAQICGCPVSYVSFIEEDRFWFKSKYGIDESMHGCPREIAFCSVTVCGADLVIAPDLVEDERFRDFPFVVNEPHFRFYCAMPLVTPEGFSIGTVCVMDFEPRVLSVEQQESLRRLAHQLVGLLEHRRRMIELDEAMAELDRAHRALADEKARSDDLLHRILPESVADELKRNGRVAPRFFQSATVLLCDVKGFTTFTRQAEPASLIDLLDRYFAAFDDAIAENGLEKVKTIGDAYLAVGGVPRLDRNHAVRACLTGLALLRICEGIRKERQKLRLPHFELRIGIHSGPLIAGVVGRRRFTYDIWGDAVNTAATMEAAGEAGRINVSETVHHHVEAYFEFTGRGSITGKDGSAMAMYFLDRLKPEFAADPDGSTPNARLVDRLRLDVAASSLQGQVS